MASLNKEIALPTPSSRRGRILRLKCGYNPNSSSIGSVVFLLSSKMLAFSAAFGLAAGLIYSWFDRSSNSAQKRDDQSEPHGEPQIGLPRLSSFDRAHCIERLLSTTHVSCKGEGTKPLPFDLHHSGNGCSSSQGGRLGWLPRFYPHV